MSMIKFICPVCLDDLEQVTEHLDETKTQPEMSAQYWCPTCQDYFYEEEVNRIEW